ERGERRHVLPDQLALELSPLVHLGVRRVRPGDLCVHRGVDLRHGGVQLFPRLARVHGSDDIGVTVVEHLNPAERLDEVDLGGAHGYLFETVMDANEKTAGARVLRAGGMEWSHGLACRSGTSALR